MSQYEDRERFILANILDPWFKMKWCRDENEKKTINAVLIWHTQIVEDKNPN